LLRVGDRGILVREDWLRLFNVVEDRAY
jgi:hypothetical protein